MAMLLLLMLLMLLMLLLLLLLLLATRPSRVRKATVYRCAMSSAHGSSLATYSSQLRASVIASPHVSVSLLFLF